MENTSHKKIFRKNPHNGKSVGKKHVCIYYINLLNVPSLSLWNHIFVLLKQYFFLTKCHLSDQNTFSKTRTAPLATKQQQQ